MLSVRTDELLVSTARTRSSSHAIFISGPAHPLFNCFRCTSTAPPATAQTCIRDINPRRGASSKMVRTLARLVGSPSPKPSQLLPVSQRTAVNVGGVHFLTGLVVDGSLHRWHVRGRSNAAASMAGNPCKHRVAAAADSQSVNKSVMTVLGFS